MVLITKRARTATMTSTIPKLAITPETERLVEFRHVSRPHSETPFSSHRGAVERMAPLCWPEISPSFQIDCAKPIFTIGSCFARNIELRLREIGSPVPTFDFPMTAEEWHGRPDFIINKYTPATIHNEISWCHTILSRGDGFQASDTLDLLYEIGDGMVVDGSLAGFRPITRERAIERRKALFDYFAQAFEAETVVITLGLTEGWWDTSRQRFIEEMPMNRQLRQHFPSDFHFCRLTYAESKALVADTIRLLNSISGPKRFLVTTSPVPLSRTFTDDDVIVANTHAKSLLRTVCGEVAQEMECVDYFPSYETVVLSKDWSVYEADRQHASQAVIAQIMARVIEKYFVNVPAIKLDLIQSVAKYFSDDIEEAIVLARNVVAKDPTSREGWSHLGLCHKKLKQWDKAIEAREKACSLAPQDELALADLMYVCISSGRAAKAVEIGEDFLSKHPAAPWVERALAGAYCRNSMFEQSLALADKLLQENAIDNEAYSVMSEIHEAQGDLEAALEAARHAARIKWMRDDYTDRVTDLEARLEGTLPQPLHNPIQKVLRMFAGLRRKLRPA